MVASRVDAVSDHDIPGRLPATLSMTVTDIRRSVPDRVSESLRNKTSGPGISLVDAVAPVLPRTHPGGDFQMTNLLRRLLFGASAMICSPTWAAQERPPTI